MDAHVVQVLTGADRNATRRDAGHLVFRTIGILPGFGPGDNNLLYGITVHQHPRIIESVRQIAVRREGDGIRFPITASVIEIIAEHTHDRPVAGIPHIAVVGTSDIEPGVRSVGIGNHFSAFRTSGNTCHERYVFR